MCRASGYELKRWQGVKPEIVVAARSMSQSFGVLCSVLRGYLLQNPLEILHREATTKLGLLCGALGLGRTAPSRGPGDASRDFSDPRPVLLGCCSSVEALPSHCSTSVGRLQQDTDDALWDGFLWAVPKKRTSHSKKRMRMAHKYLKPKHHYYQCPSCGHLKLQHMLCGHCLKETLRKTAEIRKQREAERREGLLQSGEKREETVSN